jgi:putative FmdB family regulatory protein
MPIFDYRCQKCGAAFELLVLKGTVPACTSCNSKKVDQQVSTFAVASQDMTRARVAKARSAYKSSGTFKDQQVAEAEAIKHHYEDHH